MTEGVASKSSKNNSTAGTPADRLAESASDASERVAVTVAVDAVDAGLVHEGLLVVGELIGDRQVDGRPKLRRARGSGEVRVGKNPEVVGPRLGAHGQRGVSGSCGPAGEHH